jgi:type 1 glutamine amidotransferase
VKNILLVTKGHPFDKEAFFQIFDQMEEVNWTHVEQPAAQVFFDVKHADQYDAFVIYDMPGIEFNHNSPPTFTEPPSEYKKNLLELINKGHGFVFLHHAIAGWPLWDDYAEILGGRFLYMPGSLRGKDLPDSGYRHGVEHMVKVVRDHPVTQGVPMEFPITDELYLSQVFEDSIQPLLVSDYQFTAENFYSAAKAVAEGKMFDNDGWTHASGSKYVGWSREPENSRIVYLQCGDDSMAYANVNFRKLVSNAIGWVSERV